MQAAGMCSRADTRQGRIRRGALLCVTLTFFAAGVWADTAARSLTRNEIRSMTSRERSLPEGPGKEETRKVCSGCHELEKFASVSQDRAAWQNTLEKMIALGAKATEQEYNVVLDYLVKYFPAEDTPLINVNKPTAIELESGLTIKRSEAAAIIKYRGKVGKFESLEDLKRVPGVDVARIEAKKSRLMFEE